MIISNSKRRIIYISKIYQGTDHDFAILKKEFPIQIENKDQNWFAKQKIRIDLGFKGFSDDYKVLDVKIPHKRKRKKKGQKERNELTLEQKEYNKEVGKERVVVEHSIGGMKRYRILMNCIRLKFKNDMISNVVGVCAGLWNFINT